MSVSRAISGSHRDSFSVCTSYSEVPEALNSVRILLLERLADLPLHVLPAPATVLQVLSSALQSIDDFSVLQAFRRGEPALTLVLPAKVLIWALRVVESAPD
jgi:hypothetical protein